MRHYLIKRLALAVLVLFGVSAITFFLSRVVPGNPAAMWVGPKPTQEQLEAAVKELGLDKPLAVQYLIYVKGLIRGDLGVSLRTRRRVSAELAERFAATFELVTVAMLMALILGVPVGVVSATRKDKPIDHLSRGLSISGVAMPVFWLGMLLQMTFHGALGWLPLQGRIASKVLIDHPLAPLTGFYLLDSFVSANWLAFMSALRHIALPAVSLSLVSLAVVTRMSRSSMLEVLREEYVETARAYGVSERIILYKYALKNALIPTLTVVGFSYGFLLGGSFMVESIFDWPGLGHYTVLSITHSDFPSIMGVTLVFAVIYVFINLSVDLLYYLLDPRIKKPGASG